MFSISSPFLSLSLSSVHSISFCGKCFISHSFLFYSIPMAHRESSSNIMACEYKEATALSICIEFINIDQRCFIEVKTCIALDVKALERISFRKLSCRVHIYFSIRFEIHCQLRSAILKTFNKQVIPFARRRTNFRSRRVRESRKSFRLRNDETRTKLFCRRAPIL